MDDINFKGKKRKVLCVEMCWCRAASNRKQCAHLDRFHASFRITVITSLQLGVGICFEVRTQERNFIELENTLDLLTFMLLFAAVVIQLYTGTHKSPQMH